MILACVAATWSPALFDMGSARRIEPFRTIVHRARIDRLYRDNAPDKLDGFGEFVGDLLKKNIGQVKKSQ